MKLIPLLLAQILMLCPLPGQAAAGADKPVTVASAAFDTAYLKWLSQPSSKRSSKMTTLNMPMVSVYAADGRLLYHGDDSHTNAAFLDNLLKKPVAAGLQDSGNPKLNDWLQMFPQLQSQVAQRSSRYTVLAVTYPFWDACKEQNQAVDQLRKASASEVKVFELRLGK